MTLDSGTTISPSIKVGTTARQVSFGVKDKWVIKTLTGTIACSSATFGGAVSPLVAAQGAGNYPNKSVRIVVQDAGTAAELYRSPDAIAVQLGV